ncbi:MAG: NAD(P)-dependent oxidoreductase, partial [Burkholderiaceae bacterium]|nr:NAD(P)-dependent oxidoreductase [Burkholderiaceae bacterium]
MAAPSPQSTAGQPRPDLSNYKVGFIGLGDIGLPMVANLLRAKAEVWVHDLRDEAMDKAAGLGAKKGGLSELAKHCDFICIAVINERQMREVVLGADGLLAQCRPGQTLIVHATVPPRAIKELAKTVQARGVNILDAPMSGANIAAKAGTLAFLVGGKASVLDSCRPLLNAMGTSIFHLGEIGNGQVGKLVNGL